MNRKEAKQSNVLCHWYLYWGFCRKVSIWLRQPPARFRAPSPLTQDPNIWDSFQVLAKEKTEVLISLQMDISVKWVRKSSNGILNEALFQIFVHQNRYLRNLPEFAVVLDAKPQLFPVFGWNCCPFWRSGKHSWQRRSWVQKVIMAWPETIWVIARWRQAYWRPQTPSREIAINSYC